MVTCKLTGGLGNLMYVIAATIAYAKKWNMPYAIPTTTTNPRWKHYKFPGVHYEDVGTTGFYHYKEPALFYNQRPYDITVQDIPYHENIILEGHFLSHKYFWEYKDEILPMFGFSVGRFGGLTSIHVRRADYLTMQEYLPVQPLEYYKNAIDCVTDYAGRQTFMVCSDDIDWCRENINTINLPKAKHFIYSDRDEKYDLEFMASCPISIYCNSTFSLWSHYLSKHKNKMTIYPKNWYGPAYGEVNCKDLYPETAIIL